MDKNTTTKKTNIAPYLSMLGMWALAFGCSVGQGAFVMPGGTFLPIAGPVGTAIGIGLGAIVMIILAKNYHYLMNRYPDAGGTYTYTKRCFGYDHGFLSAWFLILTYVAILWANATALPIIARIFFGNTFRFGFHYEIAGFHIYFGEILLSVVAMTAAAFICLKKKLAEWVQIVMGVLLVIGVIACFIAAVVNHGSADAPMFTPAFSDSETPIAGIFTIFALAPWAYAGFESVSHSAGEAKFPLKRTFIILVVAIGTAALAYILLALLATTYTPDGLNSWQEYVSVLGEYGGKGVSAQPTFYAAFRALGNVGSLILGLAAFCGIFTGLIGNFIAVSRLAGNMAEDKMLPVWIGKRDKNGVPSRVIFVVLITSLVIPFFGRTAISWIVDVTTVGATIAYMFTSAAAFKTAREEKSTQGMVFGVTGFIVSLFFAIAFLIPNLISVKTLATESYLIFAAWGLIGFLVFYWLLRHDDKHRLGRSNVALIVMLGLIIFTSTVWMSQSTDIAIKNSAGEINGYYTGVLEEVGVDVTTAATKPTDQYLNQSLAKVDAAFGVSTMIQIGLIVLAVGVLFVIYAHIQKREKQVEVEKAIAEETSRAKTSFLSNMSHEIRTPMNAIIGLDNIALRDPDLSPKTREHLEKIGMSAKHLLGLINDILDMSRIESGRMVLKDEEFSFRELVDQVNIIINGQCVDKGLDYECNIVGHLSDYYIGDDMKLKQVLINILGNSVKFTPTGGAVTLTIEQTGGGDDVKKIRFTMNDTGIGMDKEFIPKIFDSFSQEDATATNRYGGSGLGMAITKNFVEMMDGTIAVESEKGVGSTFTVTVPLKASKRSHQAEQKLSLPDGFRAMVVDDDEIACEHARLVLGAIGIQSDYVSSAGKAYDMMKAAFDSGEGYGLLLTDYKMPDMNGRELAKKVRLFDGGATAIIMLTGYNWDIIEEEVRADGVDSIIAKPLFTDNLLRAVQYVLDNKSGKMTDQKEEQEPVETVLAGRRVLVAEDVDANAEILADLLDLEDVVSERAVNGQVAVEMFASKPAGYYDAILMDVRMPVMDGLIATKTIRALDKEDAKTIPIIAMTANVFDEDVERSLSAGMNAHLSKPIEPEKLYEKMAELLKKA